MMCKPKLFRIVWLTLMLTACNTGQTISLPPNCDGLIYPVATRPLNSDPDIFASPTPLTDEEDLALCPTPTPSAEATENPPENFVVGDLVNLTLNPQSQSLRDIAIGDDMVALGWVENGEAFVALAKGGGHMQVRPLHDAEDVSLAFSRANRLHVAYELNEQLFYQMVDSGQHPVLTDPIYIGEGHNPHVIVDELNWAHVIFERDGGLYRAKHLVGEQWYTTFIANGTNPSLITFYNDDKSGNVFGIPADDKWFGLLMGVDRGGAVGIYRFLSWFNAWEQLIAFPIPDGEILIGSANLDYGNTPEPDSEDAWIFASWVTVREATDPVDATVVQPIFSSANPLAPTAVSNPQWVYADFNSARWYSEEATHDATLYQQVDVGNGSTVTFSAYGQCWSSEADDPLTSIDPANCRMAVGIDPHGGVNPNSPNIVWSGEQSPLNTFSQLTVNTIAINSPITVFMRSRPDAAKRHNESYWDEAELSVGMLLNGDFEGTYNNYQGNPTLRIPDGWMPVFADNSYTGPPTRDIYTIYGTYSSDGGRNWSEPFVVVQNKTASLGITGAIAANAYPFISFATDPPSVTVFYIYESGDPPPDTTFLRYGRLYSVTCELGTAVCEGQTVGNPLFSRQEIRPSDTLMVAKDPFNPSRALFAWESLQEDYESKDIFSTFAILR